MGSEVLALLLDNDATCDVYTCFFVGVEMIVEGLFLLLISPGTTPDCCSRDEEDTSLLPELAGVTLFVVLAEAAFAEVGLFANALLLDTAVVFPGVVVKVFVVEDNGRSLSRDVDVAVRGLLFASLVLCCDVPLPRVSAASTRGETSVGTPTLLLMSVIKEVGMRVDNVFLPDAVVGFCRR